MLLTKKTLMCFGLTVAAWGQTSLIDLQRQAKNANFSTFTLFMPPIGTALPSTCLVGQVFFKTNAAAGSNLYGCTAANTWTAQAGGGGGGGTGTVTSVGLTVPSWLSVTGTPVTTVGTLAVIASGSQTIHRVIGTCGAATSFAPCALVAGDLPSISTGLTGLLPVANGGTGTATPALVQGTNVTITGTWPNQTINASGGGGAVSVTAADTSIVVSPSPGTGTFTLAVGNPSSTVKGGTQSKAVVASNFLTGISTSGVPSAAQPAFTDISGTAAAAQLPLCSSAAFGACKVDNVTITASAGVITAVAGIPPLGPSGALIVSGGNLDVDTAIVDLLANAQTVTGAKVFNQLRLNKLTVATLPTCNGGLETQFAAVTDAAATPVYNAIVASGGTVHIPVYCDGTNWRNR